MDEWLFEYPLCYVWKFGMSNDECCHFSLIRSVMKRSKFELTGSHVFLKHY